MYLAYWGLGHSPFKGSLDPRTFHQGPAQEEALARLHFLVDQQRTLGLLSGASGSGKSLLLEVLVKELGVVGRQSALVNLLGIGRHELLGLVAGQLGIDMISPRDDFSLCRAIEDQLLANRYQQISTILLLDDADEAAPDALDEIARLAGLNQARDARLTMVVAARPESVGRLGTRLLELSELRVDLEGWDADDTAAFIKKSLAAAGRSTPIFTEAAVRRLHALAGGLPRPIKQLADLSLLAGAGANLTHVEPELVDSAFHELGVVPSGALLAGARS